MKRMTEKLPVLAAVLLIAGCQSSGPTQTPAAPEQGLRVLSVSAAELGPTTHGREEPGLAEACRDWRLTPEQVERFFSLSQRYAEGSGLHQRFYFLPCRITGELEENGQRWSFAINAAATASWKNGNEVREFGCSAAECEALVLMMPDGGEAEE
jgi:hypothetical protein